MTKRNEQIKKGIAKIVRSELDRQKYEDSAWLKAFSKAKGKKDMARVNYINIRTKDLWSTEAKNIQKIFQKNYKNFSAKSTFILVVCFFSVLQMQFEVKLYNSYVKSITNQSFLFP